MIEFDLALVVGSFIAGLLTFLAPCTLPLVPGYLGFISGVSSDELKDSTRVREARRKIFKNAVLYVLGFSVVFIILGILFGLFGSVLGGYQLWLSRIGGVFVITFGLFMMGVLRFRFLGFFQAEHQPRFIEKLKPGNPLSSFLFGTAFAFGWTPCVGPVLATVLIFTTSTSTILQGGFLLAVFSLGLSIPFLLIALAVGSATKFLNRINAYLKVFSFVGGIFIVFLGILLLTNRLGFWTSYFFELFDFINYGRILNFL
ncbi:MAG: cytochrome C biogenesis protein [Candidatus Harrisonbacteria bacterium CG10_big_fil_rev_8_21_14_0_10_42_17]|uniref:Cytochrome C biogenesis protein n=1 Tax=Candidatus Harrisonbacteria bacterium CG10_big_fil_rev_8_21_14_0_10_42_17 TaxID=1974584 RepID=A0A2M6WJ94_9BACT|nr:MAG: cytochrome C biogenesis protein [Candidatus Harrisonbacteria bacterium CG10_big_fil_rev_8_21_14_0_10_42_17]